MHCAIGRADEQRRLASESIVGELRDRAREQGRHARIDRIATGVKRLHGDLGYQRRACGNRCVPAAHDWAEHFPAQYLALPKLLLRPSPPSLREYDARR